MARRVALRGRGAGAADGLRGPAHRDRRRAPSEIAQSLAVRDPDVRRRERRHHDRIDDSPANFPPRRRVKPEAPGTDAEVLHLLQTVFGHPEFRGTQGEIVRHVANGGDALVLMPTGAGKSLCYQVPALLREGCAVVVSPLIALMADQVSALTQLGVRAAYLNS
ncbi:MAG: DEAD/DEAH box helicase, partial [Burkholderiales bacterium]|nr:DEAD/DEAH box helicase [Burkholderiales bacterium]